MESKLSWKANAAVVMMYVQVGLATVSIAYYMSRILLIMNLQAKVTISNDTLMLSDNMAIIVARSSSLLTIITAIIFLMWLYDAYRLTKEQFPAGLSSTPGFVVGCYFIPFINLVRPYEFMKELWLARPKVLRDEEKASPTSTVPVGAWWSLMILRGTASWVAIGFSNHQADLEKIKTMSYGSVASFSLAIPAALLTIHLIRSISTQKQIYYPV